MSEYWDAGAMPHASACMCATCRGVYGRYTFTPAPQPWECPRCHKMHGPKSLACDCKGSAGTAPSGGAFGDG